MDPNGATGSARADQWLWAVRLFKTRTSATDACRGGHVKVNGTLAKAASKVRAGDRVEVRLHGRDRVLEVVQTVGKRLPASLVAEYAVDRSPPEPPRDEATFARDRGSGRPTKRDRRRLDRLRS